jgi:hypothetical protein
LMLTFALFQNVSVQRQQVMSEGRSFPALRF